MGKAGMPYARSVQQMHPLPLNRLPDASLVFDTLLRRQQVSFFLSPSCLNAYTSSSGNSSCLSLRGTRLDYPV